MLNLALACLFGAKLTIWVKTNKRSLPIWMDSYHLNRTPIISKGSTEGCGISNNPDQIELDLWTLSLKPKWGGFHSWPRSIESKGKPSKTLENLVKHLRIVYMGKQILKKQEEPEQKREWLLILLKLRLQEWQIVKWHWTMSTAKQLLDLPILSI